MKFHCKGQKVFKSSHAYYQGNMASKNLGINFLSSDLKEIFSAM